MQTVRPLLFQPPSSHSFPLAEPSGPCYRTANASNPEFPIPTLRGSRILASFHRQRQRHQLRWPNENPIRKSTPRRVVHRLCAGLVFAVLVSKREYDPGERQNLDG